MDKLTAAPRISSGADHVQILSWVGFISGAVLVFLLLLTAGEMLGSYRDGADLLAYVAVAVIPAAAATLLSLRGKFAWASAIGVWYLSLGFVSAVDGVLATLANAVLLFAALILFLLPFVRATLLKVATERELHDA
ncbi:MAG: hypothetical protein WEA09_05275 [Gemmatimonadota bacterium]